MACAHIQSVGLRDDMTILLEGLPLRPTNGRRKSAVGLDAGGNLHKRSMRAKPGDSSWRPRPERLARSRQSGHATGNAFGGARSKGVRFAPHNDSGDTIALPVVAALTR